MLWEYIGYYRESVNFYLTPFRYSKYLSFIFQISVISMVENNSQTRVILYQSLSFESTASFSHSM